MSDQPACGSGPCTALARHGVAGALHGLLRGAAAVAIVAWLSSAALAQTTAQSASSAAPGADLTAGLGGPEQWTSPQGIGASLQLMALLAVLSLAPAVLLMTTSFVRIVVVLGLLRQAIGAQQLPPTQVITSLALFMTLLVMTPVWRAVYRDAIDPYSRNEISLQQAWEAGCQPVRKFMADQIRRTGNDADVHLFLRYLPQETAATQAEATELVYYGAAAGQRDVPLAALLPAFLLSELKTAFLIGFQIYLPFVILDLVVSSITVSMGMMMLPPVMISLPLKLLLFVMVDGWHLVVEMLLASFAQFT